mmetsp:Transcript_60057/g.141680  ORF Transcript_60057/g.141680 Transcript_60057/m.141680 type:complete len:267 (-) Transcript_60057:785-1585(-)
MQRIPRLVVTQRACRVVQVQRRALDTALLHAASSREPGARTLREKPARECAVLSSAVRDRPELCTHPRVEAGACCSGVEHAPARRKLHHLRLERCLGGRTRAKNKVGAVQTTRGRQGEVSLVAQGSVGDEPRGWSCRRGWSCPRGGGGGGGRGGWCGGSGGGDGAIRADVRACEERQDVGVSLGQRPTPRLPHFRCTKRPAVHLEVCDRAVHVVSCVRLAQPAGRAPLDSQSVNASAHFQHAVKVNRSAGAADRHGDVHPRIQRER